MAAPLLPALLTTLLAASPPPQDVGGLPAAPSPDVAAQNGTPAPSTARATLPSHVVAVNFGLASAVGVAGVTYMYAGLSPFELEMGVGEGHSGMLVSAMAKLAAGSVAHRFVVGVGLADTVLAAAEVSGHPLWLNLDLAGYEHRRGNLFLGAAVGYTSFLTGGRYCAPDRDCSRRLGPFSDSGPQFRLMMGAAF